MNHHVHHWSSSPPLIIIAIVDHFRHLWSPLPSLIIIIDHHRHHWSASPSLIAIVYLHRLWRHCWSPSPLLITITIVDHHHHHSSLSLIEICFLSLADYLSTMDPNSGANFAHADRPDQPNLYFWEKILQWANFANFCPIWSKSCTEVFGKPLKWFRIFKVAAWPTKTEQ